MNYKYDYKPKRVFQEIHDDENGFTYAICIDDISFIVKTDRAVKREASLEMSHP